MTWWDSLWAWSRDAAVWDSLRPAFAALIGALVGGLFTLWGQRRASTTQITRDEKAALREEDIRRRDQARADARALFEDFTQLHREIQEAPASIGQQAGLSSWRKEWKAIWTRERSLVLDVRARLVPDDASRRLVQELVQLLDLAGDVSGGYEAAGNPVALSTPLHYVVSQLSAEGIEVMGAYLRGATHATTRQQMWDDMRRARSDLADWQQHEVDRAEAMAEEYAEELERQRRAES